MTVITQHLQYGTIVGWLVVSFVFQMKGPYLIFYRTLLCSSQLRTVHCTTCSVHNYVVPIGEDPAAHGHWCAFTDLYHTIPYHTIQSANTIPWVCYRRRNQWLRLALASFCLPLIWLARVVYLLVPYHTSDHITSITRGHPSD